MMIEQHHQPRYIHDRAIEKKVGILTTRKNCAALVLASGWVVIASVRQRIVVLCMPHHPSRTGSGIILRHFTEAIIKLQMA